MRNPRPGRDRAPAAWLGAGAAPRPTPSRRTRARAVARRGLVMLGVIDLPLVIRLLGGCEGVAPGEELGTRTGVRCTGGPSRDRPVVGGRHPRRGGRGGRARRRARGAA